MLGVWETGGAPMGIRSHVAFHVTLPNLQDSLVRLKESGIQPLDFFGSPAEEPVVLAWMPAASVYFNDPDNNQLEFITMLSDPPQAELGILSWSNWLSSKVGSGVGR